MNRLTLAVAAALGACDLERALPPTPAARHAEREAQLGEALDRQARALPGVVSAAATVHLPHTDPFAPVHIAPPRTESFPSRDRPRITAAIALAADADPSAVRTAIATAARTIAGADAEVALDLIAAPAPPRAVTVGPFAVAPASRTPLLVALSAGLATIAGLAVALAWALAQRGTKPQ